MPARVIRFEPKRDAREASRRSIAEAEVSRIEQDRADLERQRAALEKERRELAEQRLRLADELRQLGELRRYDERRREALRLRLALADAGVTQEQVAREAGVTRTAVSHVLAGRSRSANVVDAAERLLGRSVMRTALSAQSAAEPGDSTTP